MISPINNVFNTSIELAEQEELEKKALLLHFLQMRTQNTLQNWYKY